MTESVRQFWDEQAATFDDEPDHGLRDPAVRQAWAELLLPLLPEPRQVTDLGCGTGTLSVLLAEAGHDVRGLDLADEMVAAARRKAAAAGVTAEFRQGDAAEPPYEDASTDVVLARHVLWAMPDPGEALRRWTRLLRPGGMLILVEGRWRTGEGSAGIAAGECALLVREHRGEAVVRLLPEPVYWGKEIDDERYLLVSAR
ncbi:class I SAM-dependent methyltransferase [Labedaea rhizosphaerae]|nr:class I SAM-dependent methyltransferase [Labedaea rhizosphaerae]